MWIARRWGLLCPTAVLILCGFVEVATIYFVANYWILWESSHDDSLATG